MLQAIYVVTQRSYGHYENGTRSLPLEHLIKLTELYGVSSDLY